MKIASLLFKYAPNRMICRELKLLYANNRLIEAFDGRDITLMALTKLEKFVLKRAFKELRRKYERERLKEWAVAYAITGKDPQPSMSGQQLDLPYVRPPYGVTPNPDALITNAVRSKQFTNAWSAYEEQKLEEALKQEQLKQERLRQIKELIK